MRAASSQNGNGTAHSLAVKHAANGNGNKRYAKPRPRSSAQIDLVSLIQAQTENVQSLLKSLYEVGKEIEAEELDKVSGIPYTKYGGLFGAVSKAATKAKIPLEDIYTKDTRFVGTERQVWYAPGTLLKEQGGAAFHA